ncbi:MAG: protease HtpX [Elusimicrobiota bacterium]|jgi:heat shock protein HtpX
MFKRIGLFLLVNFLVMMVLSAVVSGLEAFGFLRGPGMQSLLIMCAVWGFGGAFISLQLSRWMAKRSLGVQLVDPENPRDSREAFLVERIRMLSSRAGLAVLPEIGIYPSPEVNAFATGPSKSRSLVAVSEGLLRRMDDRAVEGVLAHELSHVSNGDMVTMTLLQGVANTFVMFLARVGAFAIDNLMRSRDENGRGLGPMARWLLVMALEMVFMLLASIVIYAFSRRREYRADAGAARVSSKENMIHALEALKRTAGLPQENQPSLATMKINGRGSGLMARLFSTHPNLDARIEALQRLA